MQMFISRQQHSSLTMQQKVHLCCHKGVSFNFFYLCINIFDKQSNNYVMPLTSLTLLLGSLQAHRLQLFLLLTAIQLHQACAFCSFSPLHSPHARHLFCSILKNSIMQFLGRLLSCSFFLHAHSFKNCVRPKRWHALITDFRTNYRKKKGSSMSLRSITDQTGTKINVSQL